ncbi:MAG TPA: hypothetical protein VIG97_08435 [Luteimonas sp.]
MDDREVDRGGTPLRWLAGTVLVLCGGLATGPVSAQWAVVDLPHTIKTALGWVAQYQQMIEDYKQQVEQLRSLERQYEQGLVTGDAYAGDSGYRENFVPLDIDTGVDRRCGTASGRQPKGAELHAHCVSIVRTENRRFNALVAMLDDVDKRDEELRAAYAERGAIRPEEEGRLASNTNRILSIQGQLQNDVQSGERLMSAYDSALQTLRDSHVRLANEALQEAPAGGELVQGAMLKVALRAARERER